MMIDIFDKRINKRMRLNTDYRLFPHKLLAVLTCVSFYALLCWNAFALESIIIDPGHGGEDSGCVGFHGSKEKDINLQIAKRLASLIQNRMGIVATLTRKEDDFVDLTQRIGKTNNSQADIFISIHSNASLSTEDTGRIIIFISSDFNMIENHLNHGQKLTGKGESSVKTMKYWDEIQTDFANESFRLASILSQEAIKSGIWREAVIKDAPLFVLKGAAMAAIETELDFLTSSLGEERLTNHWYQERICEVFYRAILQFITFSEADPNVSSF